MDNIEMAVVKYRAIRDRKEEIQKRHKEELKPYNAGLEALENWFLKSLQGQGVEHYGTKSGTAYLSTITKPKVEDGEAFIQFLKEEGLLHMLELRPSKTAVEEYIEATGEVPPGLSIQRETFARVRK